MLIHGDVLHVFLKFAKCTLSLYSLQTLSVNLYWNGYQTYLTVSVSASRGTHGGPESLGTVRLDVETSVSPEVKCNCSL